MTEPPERSWTRTQNSSLFPGDQMLLAVMADLSRSRRMSSWSWSAVTAGVSRVVGTTAMPSMGSTQFLSKRSTLYVRPAPMRYSSEISLATASWKSVSRDW